MIMMLIVVITVLMMMVIIMVILTMMTMIILLHMKEWVCFLSEMKNECQPYISPCKNDNNAGSSQPFHTYGSNV